MNTLINKKYLLFFMVLFSLACSNKNITTNELPIENNILQNRSSFSLNYNQPSAVNKIEADSGHVVFSHLINKGNCVKPLTEITFAKAISLIAKEKTLIDKIELSKKIIEKNCLTTYQIKRIGDFYKNETSKLEIFEYAFSFCYDTQNYFTLDKEFILKNNKMKLKAIYQ